ncbi:ABC transporter ATP-binding protein [Pusillimonas noertemannii]|uniref:ABC transporter ATP-binding protein n=1 Tax=Pusillimonas noertemannii TaxID=305977 RepID=UPI000317B86D|nr:ABC transporter ATP-binding protein [Pusillimonas noertemannii]
MSTPSSLPHTRATGAAPAAGAPAAVVLETRKLCLSFGALKVTRDVDFQLRAGERHALIGSNGAGKSTLVNLLAGVLQPHSGDILLDGERINKLAPFQRVRRGLVRTFQITALFGEMTPLDSVALAVCQANGAGLSFVGASPAHARAVDEAAEILRTVGLLEHARDETRFMAYGHQRLLEIALALACKPRVLLLDEPAAGVPMGESRRLFQTLAELPGDLTILLIEHDMKLVFQFASRISVLAEGALLAQGTPNEIANDERVRQSYLGHSHA